MHQHLVEVGQQRQVNFCEFKVSLVLKASFRRVRDTVRLCLKKQQ